MRLALAACNQKFRNVRFATAACAKMYEICVSLQFRAIGAPNPARWFIQQIQNARLATAARNQKFPNKRFATAACAKMYETSARRPRYLAAYKNHRLPQFWRSDEHEVTKGLPVDGKNLRFTSVLDVRRLQSDETVRGHTDKFAFHHSFERPTFTFCVNGCSGNLKNLHFSTVLSVRRSLFALTVARAI